MRSSLFPGIAIVKNQGRRMIDNNRDRDHREFQERSFLLKRPDACYPLAPVMDKDADFMQLALEQGRAAALAAEVPVGAVLVRDGEVVALAGNRTVRDCDPTAHAEILVLREGARKLGNYRLAATTLYATIEPCSMCAGAIIQARVPRVVYGCDDPKGGAVRSCFEILTHPRLNHRVEVTAGLLASECAALIQSFFADRR
jgi:tRNA(adenine34) deaminase